MTSLALYLSLPEGLHRLEEKSLHAFVAEEFASADPDLRPFFDLPLSRVYAGAEFCTHLLPGPVAIGKLAAVLRRVNIPFTFVTPPTPQHALGRVRRILSCLERLAAGGEEAIEVVINDWGVLRMMKRYPSLQPVLGRGMAKLYNDTFFKVDEDPLFARVLPELRSNCCTNPAYRDYLRSLAIHRMEFDWPEQGIDMDSAGWGFALSLYLPFVYLASGRRCTTGVSALPYFERSRLERGCSRPCRDVAVLVQHTRQGTGPPLFCRGNTLYQRSTRVPDLLPPKLAAMGFDRLVLFTGYPWQ
jgi:hypothetical protein